MTEGQFLDLALDAERPFLGVTNVSFYAANGPILHLVLDGELIFGGNNTPAALRAAFYAMAEKVVAAVEDAGIELEKWPEVKVEHDGSQARGYMTLYLVPSGTAARQGVRYVRQAAD